MRSKVIFVIAVFILITIGAVANSLLHPRANIDLILSPSPASAKLDGKKTVHQGKLYVSPGKHSITAGFNGFSSRSVSFTATAGGLQTVTVFLNANSQVGLDWLANHPADSSARQSISDQNYSDENQQRVQTNPIINILPHVDNFYRIDYGKSQAHPNDQSAVAVYITYYSEDGKQQALQWLQFEGYDPASLEIIYQDDTSQGFN